MAYNNQKLHGKPRDVAQMIRPDVDPRRIAAELSRVHKPGLLEKILGAAAYELAELGIEQDEHGKFRVLAGTVESPPAVSGEHSALLLEELAHLLVKAKVSKAPKVNRSEHRQIRGYEDQIGAESVRSNWAGPDKGPRACIDIIHRAPSIQEAEVSVMAHNGAFSGQDNSLAAVSGHAARLIVALESPTSANNTVLWKEETHAADSRYTMTRSDIGHQAVPALINCRTIGKSAEFVGRVRSNGTFTAFAQRRVALTAETVFVLSPNDSKVFGEPAPGEVLGLDEELTMLAESYVADKDISLVVPAYTSFIMKQEIISAA